MKPITLKDGKWQNLQSNEPLEVNESSFDYYCNYLKSTLTFSEFVNSGVGTANIEATGLGDSIGRAIATRINFVSNATLSINVSSNIFPFGSSYKISFWAIVEYSASNKTLNVNLRNDSQNFTITPSWQKFTANFTPTIVNPFFKISATDCYISIAELQIQDDYTDFKYLPTDNIFYPSQVFSTPFLFVNGSLFSVNKGTETISFSDFLEEKRQSVLAQGIRSDSVISACVYAENDDVLIHDWNLITSNIVNNQSFDITLRPINGKFMGDVKVKWSWI